MEDLLNGAQTPENFCINGMTLDFAIEISKICLEIRGFYGIEESVRFPTNENLSEFLYDLSAFLLELECPHEQLSCGDISTRFENPQKCEFLLSYLLSELKSSRLYAYQKLGHGETSSEKRNLELTPIIDEALSTLKIPKQSGSTCEWRVLEILQQKVDQKISQNRREPLFKATIDEKIIPEIEMVCEMFSRDFYNRLLLLTRRLKVTVESFLWCDRISSKQAEIRSILTNRLKEIEEEKSKCNIPNLLASSSALLYIVKASAMEKRAKTRSLQHPLSKQDAPKDRGGRTNEMNAAKRETFSQQRGQRHDGGFKSNWNRGHQQQSHESQVLQQTMRSEQSYNSNEQRGRGRGRGRGQRR